MAHKLHWLSLVVVAAALAGSNQSHGTPLDDDRLFELISWNISDDAFVSEPDAFRQILAWGNPDIVVLDEVSPSANIDRLQDILRSLAPDSDEFWQISVGESGGRQRGVIASLFPVKPVPELAGMVPYPPDEKAQLLAMMSDKERANRDWSMDNGIPVNGAIITMNGRKLLVVVADLQCCGDGPDSWQEARRRAEAHALRTRINRALENYPIDGIVFAGDFNMVNSTYPMSILLGPYREPHGGLIPAGAWHLDGRETWTWDGRGTPFPSNTLDYQFYGPQALEQRRGVIFDTERATDWVRKGNGLSKEMSARTGRHRPVMVIYRWR